MLQPCRSLATQLQLVRLVPVYLVTHLPRMLPVLACSAILQPPAHPVEACLAATLQQRHLAVVYSATAPQHKLPVAVFSEPNLQQQVPLACSAPIPLLRSLQHRAQSLVPQTTTQPPQGGQQPDPSPEKQTRNGAYFSGLLERQRKKARLQPSGSGSQRGQLPALNMDLGDLARRAQEIGGRGAAASSHLADSRAHYLLAGSGVSPGKAYREFQSLDRDDTAVNRPVTNDTAVETETYIRNLRNKGRDAVMRENIDRVYREVDSYIEQTLGIDFEEQKLRIMKHFGLMSDEDDGQASPSDKGSFGRTMGTPKGSFSGSRSAFGRSGPGKSIIGTPGGQNGSSSFFKSDYSSNAGALMRGQAARDLREKERAFVQQVEALSKARLEDKPFQLMKNFGQIEKQHGGDGPAQICEAYEALQEITKEATSAKERKFAADYANNHTRSDTLDQQILAGSKTYLEKAKYREIEGIIEKNPREGRIGGQPTVVNKVRAYVRIRATRKDLPGIEELQQVGDEGDYCWVMNLLSYTLWVPEGSSRVC